MQLITLLGSQDLGTFVVSLYFLNYFTEIALGGILGDTRLKRE